MPPRLSFLKVGPESIAALRALFQHYLRDMAAWFEVETNPDGSYAYDIDSIWERGYEVYLAKRGEDPVGFALTGSAEEWFGNAPVHDMHEFFVLSRFRRDGIGVQMAAQVWSEHPGEWLVRVLEANAVALAFWRAAIASYAQGSQREDGRQINGCSWVFIRFHCERGRVFR